ncbi:hypothetical protein HY639_02065 [Candidatus Woesearchaeota archaeon]|nr:hypothetical protein [Candidatus Woesearchaeota archaeon]
MRIDHTIDSTITFTEKAPPPLRLSVILELDGCMYKIRDYLHFFCDDDFDLQASEGHVTRMELIGKLETIVYNQTTQRISLTFSGVHEYDYDLSQKPPRTKKYLPASHPFMTKFSPYQIKNPRKLTLGEYEKLTR